MSREDWNRPSEYGAAEGRRRIAMEIAYDGRQFCGWQIQDSGIAVQQVIKEAVERLTGQNNVEICGSGRTDSGVHAFGQVAHAEIDDCTIPSAAFCHGLNSFLPVSIRVKKAWDAEPSFHARYSAMAREYRYFCREGSVKNPFTEGLVADFRKLPDIDVLNGYAKQLIGTHDFTTFTCAKDICPSKVRDIYESEFFYTQSMYGERLLCYKICGNAFLYHMVRSLTGSMIEYGLNGLSNEDFCKILNAKERKYAGKTAQSCGLYLWRVSYDSDEYRWFETEYGKR